MESGTSSNRLRAPHALLAAIPVSMVLLTLLELLYVSPGHGDRRFAFYARTAGLALEAGARYLLVPVLFQLGMAMLCFFKPKNTRARAVLVGLAGLLSAGIAFHCYCVIAIYKPFAGYPPFIALHAILAGLLFLWAWSLLSDSSRRLLRWSVAAGALAGFAALHILNHSLYRGAYPTLHLGVFSSTYLLFHAGLSSLLAVARPVRFRMRPIVTVAAPVLILLLAAAPMLVASGLCEPAMSAFLRFTILGQARVLGQFAQRKDEDRDSDAQAQKAKEVMLDASEAIALFEKYNNLPELPRDFELNRYNLLLITLEAYRYDDTSLGDKELNMTPALEAFAAASNFWFDKAYSPSSQTMLVTSSMFSMTYPSACQMDINQTGFGGELLSAANTPAEILSGAGYHTFWTSQNETGFFSAWAMGIGQGFKKIKLIHSKIPLMDDQVLNEAIAALDDAQKEKGPFFGWVFFGSAHSPYDVRYPEMPSATQRDLYRQEMRYVDEHLGKLLAHVEKLGLLDNTIIVVHGDHGEAFMEHGKTQHNDIYEEIAHIPLVIHIPGMKGGRMENPTTSFYLFPWLFLSGSKEIKEAAVERLRREIGPMLKRTDGAIVSEKISAYNMRSALRYPDFSLIYDFPSRYLELYNLENDPGEQNNLFAVDSRTTDLYVGRLQGYLQVRAAVKRFAVTDWKPGVKRSESHEINLESDAKPGTEIQAQSKAEFLEAKEKIDELDAADKADLIEAVKDSNRLVRVAAIAELSRRGKLDTEVIDALIPALADPDRGVQQEAASAIALAGEAVIDPLIQAHHSEYPYRNLKYMTDIGERSIHHAIRSILLGIGKPAIVKLIEALDDKDLNIRANASYILGMAGNQAVTALPRLLRATQDKEWLIRRNAVGDLSRIAPENPAVRAAVRKALADPDLRVRNAATKSMVLIRRAAPKAKSNNTENTAPAPPPSGQSDGADSSM